LNHNLQGDSIVSWQGPCDIPTDKIVDGQDLLEGSRIFSEDMLHFIIEIFDAKLIEMVLVQRLFCELVKDEIYKFTSGQLVMDRLGDDLYLRLHPDENSAPVKDQDLKLNISIATVSPVSGLIHFGINISSKNTPVKTLSLKDISQKVSRAFSSADWGLGLMSRFQAEWLDSKKATQKVKWVR
jgi:hypothetical protein